MKALKAFIKPFEAPQRSVEIKIYLDFYFDTTFRNVRDGKGYGILIMLSSQLPLTSALAWWGKLLFIAQSLIILLLTGLVFVITSEMLYESIDLIWMFLLLLNFGFRFGMRYKPLTERVNVIHLHGCHLLLTLLLLTKTTLFVWTNISVSSMAEFR